VVIALTVLLGLVAVSRISAVGDQAEYLGSEAIEKAEHAGDALTGAADYRRIQNRLVFTEAKDAEKFVDKLDAYKAEVDDAFAGYEKLISNPQARKLFDTAKADWEDYVSRTAELPEVTRADDDKKALAILVDTEDDYEEVDQNVTALANFNSELADAALVEAEDTYSSARTLVIMLLLIVAAAGAALAFIIARAVTGGIGQMLRAANGIAEGDVEQNVDIRSRDELGETGAAFERMIDYLKEMAAATERVAAGDLTVEVTPHSERDLLGNAVHKLVTDLSQVVGEITQQAETVSSASQQMASTSEETGRAVGEIASAISDVAQGAERQVRMVEATRDAINEANTAATTSAETAAETTEAAAQTREVARDGVAAAERATDAIRQVADSSTEIGQRSASSRPSPSASAGSSTRSPASPSRPTCSRSTPRSRPPAPASRARASPSWPRRSASWPRSRRPRPRRSPS